MDQKEKRRLEDIDIITHPKKWPSLFLPLKKRDYNFDDPSGLGIMFDDSDNLEVIVGNMYYLMAPGVIESAERIKYNSVEELVAVWTVD